MIIETKPVYDPHVRTLCVKPYPGHPKGCPNFNRKVGCPPSAPYLDKFFDLSEPCYLIINNFNLGRHVERMYKAHPKWSDRQARCCLYWQGTARKELRQKILDFASSHPGYTVETCPEAMGLNVTQTLQNTGVDIEWPPKDYTLQVAFAGVAFAKAT